MKVSDYRDAISHLERQFHVHRHSCVGDAEKRSWLRVTQRIADRVRPLTCKTAKPDDLDRHRAIMRKVSEFLAGVAFGAKV